LASVKLIKDVKMIVSLRRSADNLLLDFILGVISHLVSACALVGVERDWYVDNDLESSWIC
jgi:hypothetical protein